MDKDYVLKNLITGEYLVDSTGKSTLSLKKALHMDNGQKLADMGRAIGEENGWKAFGVVHGDTGMADPKRPIK